jgi:hypothetical protein
MIDLLRELLRVLTGLCPFSDIAQDFYGFRALVLRADAYAPIGAALKTMGLDWPILHASTHPPTAYLLTAPVAFLPWPLASAVWAWLMIAAVVASLRLYGLRWRWIALVLAVCLVWPPFVYSLSQITPLWLLGLALAYRHQEKPCAAGAWIAFASLTKFFPALLLVPFVLRRQWSALAGFAAVWLAALALITALHPGALGQYLAVNQGNSLEMIARPDNAAFLPVVFALAGWPGVVFGFAFLGWFAWRGRADWHTWEFLAVALLPIAWSYSLLPLLPEILRDRKKPLVLAGVALTFLMPGFGTITPLFMTLAFCLFAMPSLRLRLRPLMPARISQSNSPG